jgi:DNA-binding transcriptional ArsR family regulator
MRCTGWDGLLPILAAATSSWLSWRAPAYPGQLAAKLGLSRSNMSNHLACLRGCGLVNATAEGRQIRYEIADPNLAHAIHDVVLSSDCAR